MSTETLPFKTELKQVLGIIIHSLYSHKEIFLRELISNASDAIDTLRFQALTKTELLEGDGEWKIKIIPDEKNRTLTISDNGIGMSKESIVENLRVVETVLRLRGTSDRHGCDSRQGNQRRNVKLTAGDLAAAQERGRRSGIRSLLPTFIA